MATVAACRLTANSRFSNTAFPPLFSTVVILVESLASITVIILIAGFPTETEAQDVGTDRGVEFYVAGFATRSSPTSSNIFLNGDKIPQTHFDASTGGGAKLGAFIRPFNFAFGGEFEIFGNGGKITSPITTQGGITRFTNQNLNMTNLMFNFIARYPGDFIQPYIGMGVGLSLVSLDGITKASTGTRTRTEDTGGVAWQAIAGIRLNVTRHIFGFTEYKHFSSTSGSDECSDPSDCPVHQLDYQSHYVSVGVGVRF
jgi:opacity protein-like surface antigen